MTIAFYSLVLLDTILVGNLTLVGLAWGPAREPTVAKSGSMESDPLMARIDCFYISIEKACF